MKTLLALAAVALLVLAPLAAGPAAAAVDGDPPSCGCGTPPTNAGHGNAGC